MQPDQKTLDDLGWNVIVGAIVGRQVGPTGTRMRPRFHPDRSGAERAARENGEALILLQDGTPLPVEPFGDLGAELLRIEKGGTLSGSALASLTRMLKLTQKLRVFLKTQQNKAPSLTRYGGSPRLDHLAATLEGAVEDDGRAKDSASVALAALRQEVSNLRTKIQNRLEDLIHKKSDILSDTIFTLRDERYVLPMRTDAHERIDGIVHGTSASGATLFIEPRSIVEAGNRLKVAISQERIEEERIFAALSETVAESLPEILAALEGLIHLDYVAACARFSKEIGANPIAPDARPVLKLLSFKHPLLTLEGTEAVPLDLALAPAHAIIISGPNAGGKTVAMKSAGLCALMVRAGLPIPAGEGSQIGFYEQIVTDIGDSQSMANNLSTFSAHVSRLVQITDAARPGALVLVDELAGATDPDEGAALAQELIERWVQNGASVIATTHYSALKAWAAEYPNAHNCAVNFDLEKLKPSFELISGMPGSSHAFEATERFGMHPQIVAGARTRLGSQSEALDNLIANLQQKVGETRSSRGKLENA